MEKLRKVLYYILSAIAIIVAVGSLLSVFRNTDSRYLKMLDFPRIQFFIISLISLVLFVILNKKWNWYDYLLALGLAGGIVVHSSYLINYTGLVAEAVPSVQTTNVAADDQISILLANVKMSNRNAQPLLDLINTKDPDIVLAMEINNWWDEQLTTIESQYPHKQETINSVAYGMTLYSKFPLENVDVNYLNNQKVPSFESTIQLQNGKDILFYSVHPVPPTRFKDLPDNAGQQEKALLKMGEDIDGKKLPVIVAGDLNDVSWGATDELTGTEDLLHDVRVGRGFYNSFNADNFFLRWPLDHIFVTEEFQLVELERLSDIGSDHFPIYAKLAL